MPPIRTVLHPTDFSKSSGYAFRLACSLTRDSGAHLIVLHVVPTSLAAEKRGFGEDLAEELNRMDAFLCCNEPGKRAFFPEPMPAVEVRESRFRTPGTPRPPS